MAAERQAAKVLGTALREISFRFDAARPKIAAFEQQVRLQSHEPPFQYLGGDMATKPNEPEDLGKLKRELNDALGNCEKLLAEAKRVLRPTDQDNDPPNPDDCG